MKKIILLAAIFCTLGFGASAQKYAFVNTDYILDNIPEYTDAQTQLDELSATWQKEIDARFAEIDKMYKSYQNEAVLLPEDMKKKREEDIIKKEREAKVENAHKKAENAKKGSLASKANMVKKFNEND